MIQSEISVKPQGAVREMPYAMDRQISSIAFLPTATRFDVTLHLSLADACKKVGTSLIARIHRQRRSLLLARFLSRQSSGGRWMQTS